MRTVSDNANIPSRKAALTGFLLAPPCVAMLGDFGRLRV